MKVLVVYYSRTGNSKKVAEEISNALKCDIERVIDTKDRAGLFGWLSAGSDSMRGNLTKIKDIAKDISRYDLIIIGGPIWSWTVCPPVRTFLTDHGDKIKTAAFFCTEGGSGSEKAFKIMASILGKDPVSTLLIKENELKKGEHLKKVSDFVDKLRIT